MTRRCDRIPLQRSVLLLSIAVATSLGLIVVNPAHADIVGVFNRSGNLRLEDSTGTVRFEGDFVPPISESGGPLVASFGPDATGAGAGGGSVFFTPSSASIVVAPGTVSGAHSPVTVQVKVVGTAVTSDPFA